MSPKPDPELKAFVEKLAGPCPQPIRPICQHGLRASGLQYQTEGANVGRWYYICRQRDVGCANGWSPITDPLSPEKVALIARFRRAREEQASLLQEAEAIVKRERSGRPSGSGRRGRAGRSALPQVRNGYDSSPPRHTGEQQDTPVARQGAITEPPLRRNIFDPRYITPSSPTPYVHDREGKGKRDVGKESILSVFFAQDDHAPILKELSWPKPQIFNLLYHIPILSRLFDIKASDIIDVFDPVRCSWDSCIVKECRWEPIVPDVPFIWRFHRVSVGRDLDVHAEHFRARLRDVLGPNDLQREHSIAVVDKVQTRSKVIDALDRDPVAGSSQRRPKRSREDDFEEGSSTARGKRRAISKPAYWEVSDVIEIDSG